MGGREKRGAALCIGCTTGRMIQSTWNGRQGRRSNHPTCAKETKGELITYKITNFLGRKDRTGKRKKQITKQARAPKLQAPKINIRSHLLTTVRRSQPFGLGDQNKKEETVLTPSLHSYEILRHGFLVQHQANLA